MTIYIHPVRNGEAGGALQDVRNGDNLTLWNTWHIPRVRKFAVLESCFPDDDPIDQFSEMRWDPPARMMLRIHWMLAGTTVRDARFVMVNPHIITPETSTSSHYFWTCAPDAASEALARAVFEGEDKPMIEAVQAQMGDADFWDLKPMILKGDVGAVRARRRLAKQIREERGESDVAE